MTKDTAMSKKLIATLLLASNLTMAQQVNNCVINFPNSV